MQAIHVKSRGGKSEVGKKSRKGNEREEEGEGESGLTEMEKEQVYK